MSPLVIVLTLFLSVSYAATRVINCNGTLTCHQQTRVCEAGKDCQVDCYHDALVDNEESCLRLNVQCPAGYKCTINCGGGTKKNCFGLRPIANESTSLVVNGLGGESILQNAEIYCPENGDCAVNCGTTENGASMGCLSMYIYAPKATTLTVTAAPSNLILGYSRILCPFDGFCTIKIGNTADTSIYEMMSGMEIRNDNGFKRMDLECAPTDKARCGGGAKLFCKGPDWDNGSNCVLIRDKDVVDAWTCEQSPNADLTCETYGLPLPTDSPSATPTEQTVSPTQYPSVSPTLPSYNPTPMPSKEPTKEPTAGPTIPTKEPTMMPTAAPTTSMPSLAPTQPSINPTVYPSEVPTPSPTTSMPTMFPSYSPTDIMAPTTTPSTTPITPTDMPSLKPSYSPTPGPTFSPTATPTSYSPTPDPTDDPIFDMMSSTDFFDFSSTDILLTSVDPTQDPTLSPTELVVDETDTTDTKPDDDADGAQMTFLCTFFNIFMAFFSAILLL